MAAANGYSEVLDFLLSQEVNVNIQDNEGWTPFHAAVCWGQVCCTCMRYVYESHFQPETHARVMVL